MHEPHLFEIAPDERFDRLARLAARLLSTPVALFSIVDGERQLFVGMVGLAEPWATRRETPLSYSFCRHVIAGDAPLLVRDASAEARFRDNPAISALGATAYAGVPVHRASGEVIGSLCVMDRSPRDWTPDDVSVLRDLAISVGTQIELGRAQEQLDDYLDNTPVLVQLSTPDGRLTFVNRTWRETLRYDAAQAERLRVGDIVAPDYRVEYLDAIARVVSGTTVPAFDTVFFDSRGQRRIMRVQLSARMENGVCVAVRGTFEDVTLQRRSDETQARLVQVLEATTDFVGVASAVTGHAIYINRAGRALVGIPEHEDISPLGLSAVYTPTAREMLISTAIPAAIRDGIWEGESAVQSRDGQEIPVSQVIIAHESAQGAVSFISTVMRDIRAQKRKETELRILQSITDAISDAEDLHTALIIALDRLCQATGWRYGEVWVPDETKRMLVHGPVWCPPEPAMVAVARAMEKLKLAPGEGVPGRVWATGRPAWQREVSLDLAVAAGLRAAVGVPVIADDDLVAVLTFGMPALTDEDEDRVRLVALIAAQLGSVMRRKRAEDDLRASEERFRRLAMVSNEGIAISREGMILEVNTAWKQMMGFDEKDLPTLRLDECAPPEQQEEIRQRMVENIEGLYYTTFRRKDGTTFEAEVIGKPCIYNGSAARISVLRDVTEWRRVDRMKSEFVSTVSHELRTPLTSIRGAIGLLEAGIGGTLVPKGADLLRVARENSDRLIRLINDLLDLDKIEAGKLELRWTTIQPSEIVRSALDGIMAMAQQNKVRLVERVEAHRSFAADRDRIVQVLTNLVSNAIKFSPAGSSVEIEAISTTTGVRFAIHNAGAGINATDRKRLFARFQQLDAADNRQHGGTGLGLAISKAIVEQHGGRIGVESEPNVRTTFWFELPAARATTVAPAKTA